MEAIWRNPYEKITEDILIGNTTFRVQGLYNDGEGEVPLSGGGAVAPIKPDFEINSVFLLINTQQGILPLEITSALEDINSITWIKETNNDIFQCLSEKVIAKHAV